MVVTEQFWSYGFMSYIAETGGFVGLFLGFSLLQLEEVLLYLSKLLRSREEKDDDYDGKRDGKNQDVTVHSSKHDAFDLVFNLQRSTKSS